MFSLANDQVRFSGASKSDCEWKTLTGQNKGKTESEIGDSGHTVFVTLYSFYKN